MNYPNMDDYKTSNKDFDDIFEVLTHNKKHFAFAILSASTLDTKGTPDERKNTMSLFLNISNIYGVDNIIPVKGHYKYDDGTLANEPSFFMIGRFTKKEILEIGKKFKQESIIYNMTLYRSSGKKIGEKIEIL
jgi:hypothetical protein